MNSAPVLTETHQKWVSAMEAERPDMPAGFAQTLVELYLMRPEFFDPANIERIKAQQKPVAPTISQGSCKIITGEEAEQMKASMDAQAGIAIVEPIARSSHETDASGFDELESD